MKKFAYCRGHECRIVRELNVSNGIFGISKRTPEYILQAYRVDKRQMTASEAHSYQIFKYLIVFFLFTLNKIFIKFYQWIFLFGQKPSSWFG